jgi:hypothetical protein
MHWSALLLLTAGLTAPAPEAALPDITLPEIAAPAQIFESYTEAHQAAGVAHKPMLVVLNPPASPITAVSHVSHSEPITVETLKQNAKLSPLLDKYVVAVVDTGTEHGKKVHEAFGGKRLPYISVIDAGQKKQIFQASHEVTLPQLQKVLATYQNGPNSQAAREIASCPLCRKNRFGF